MSLGALLHLVPPQRTLYLLQHYPFNRTLGTCKGDGVVNLRETWPESIHICFIYLSKLKGKRAHTFNGNTFV